MAQYWEDWSGESVGAISGAPAGWTRRWDADNSTLSIVTDAASPSGKALRISKSVGDRFLLSFDAVDSDADRATCEVLALIRLSSTAYVDGNNIFGCAARASGTSTSETGYVANIAAGIAGVVKINKRIAPYLNGTGQATVLAEAIGDASVLVGQLAWVKLRCNETTISVGYAPDSSGAPGTENIDPTTLTTTSAAGWVGLFSFSSGVSVDVLAVGVGTNGDAAPVEALPITDTTAPILSGAAGTKTGATSATGAVTTNEANGTMYAVATTSATAPSAAQAKAGQTHTGATAPWSGNTAVSSTGEKTFSVTGLSASTTYYLHYMHEDAADNQSTVATSSAFTTDTPDTTSPTLTSPTATATGTTTASASVSTNEATGILYYLASANASESAATVKAASSQSVNATGSQSVSITGLSAETSYYVHFVHRDAAGNDSTVVTSAQITTAAGISIRADYERSSVNLSGSSVTGEGDSAVVTINPRVQESEAYSSQSRWLEPSARVDGVNGYRPTFKFTDYAATAADGKYHGAPWESTRRPVFSYDLETWHYFDTCTVGASDITFRHNAAFTSPTVYIGRSRQIGVAQKGEWLEGMASAYPTLFHPAPSAVAFSPNLTSWPAQSFIADEFSAQTNELGQAIPATPFYAAVIDDGSPDKIAAYISMGVHAGEDHADYVCMSAVELLLGNSAEAIELRSKYRIYVYPCVNAPGRAGGGMRGSFTQGTSGADDANRHFSETTSGLEIVNKPKAAMITDRGDDVLAFGLDFHGAFSTNWGIYATNDTFATDYLSRINAKMSLVVTDMGETTSDSVGAWYLSETGGTGTTLEFGDKTPVPDSDIEIYTSALLGVLVDMSDDGTIPIYSPPPIISATTAASSTSSVSAIVTTDTAGGTIYGVLSDSATLMTAAAIKSGANDTATVTTAGIYTLDETGLATLTQYYWHIVHEDEDGLMSNVLTLPVVTLDVSIPIAFSDTAPATLLTAQLWSKVPTKAAVEGLY